jgi:hypothetical protein
MNPMPMGKSRSLLPVFLGLGMLCASIPAMAADPELQRAAEALAKSGSDFLRSTGSGSAAVVPTREPARTGGGAAAVTPPPVEAPFEGQFQGAIADGGGELRARFSGGKVEWIEPGKRSWSPKVTNGYTFTVAGGQLTVNRAGSTPLVFAIGAGRKSLTLESGEGKMVPKELKVAQP